MISQVFGPVPSRRLGKSLGINNVPYKICTYSCVYCQLGRTNKKVVRRMRFYDPRILKVRVEKRVEELKLSGEHIDFLTFAPDGEPTLDVNIDKEISLLKQLGYPVAVLTNASLLWNKSVRRSLLKADLVSLKIDSVSEGLWKLVNRPHRHLSLNIILDGIGRFTREYNGVVISETMVIDGIDYGEEFVRIAKFLEKLKRLDVAYIATPTRPPAEEWVKPARKDVLESAFQAFSTILGSDRVKLLVEHEGYDFSLTKEVENEILSIAAVHPIRREVLTRLLEKAKVSWQIVERLLQEGKLVKLEYNGREYYRAKL